MLKLYNTMSGAYEDFKPRNKNMVRIFTCGPSTYRRPHIGNYRTFLYEDILVRYLEYSGYKVKRIINLTDIEDKAIEEADKTKSNVKNLTNRVLKYFLKESKQLNIKLPEDIPSSSTSVDDAVELIKILLEKKIAYWHKGDVFFDPLKFKDFGKLFKLDMSRWPLKKKRFKRDTYNGRRWNLGDFILWHGYNGVGTVFWETEIGPGRPAWNIQDPAIISKHLGYEIDINCGGIDNIYRHHDYNIAVLESISNKVYSNFYLHGGHLVVSGKTMSKSRGNILYPEDITANGYKYHDLRFFLIYRHYRKKLNYRDDNFLKTSIKLKNLRKTVSSILKPERSSKTDKTRKDKVNEIIREIEKHFCEHMNDDLNVRKAFDSVTLQINELYNLKKKYGSFTKGEIESIKKLIDSIDSVLCILN